MGAHRRLFCDSFLHTSIPPVSREALPGTLADIPQLGIFSRADHRMPRALARLLFSFHGLNGDFPILRNLETNPLVNSLHFNSSYLAL